MAQNTELQALRRYALGSSLARIVACADGLSDADLNWRPLADDANSIGAIALHALANAEENIVGTLGGEAIARDRNVEFAGVLVSSTVIRERFDAVQQSVTEVLARLTPADLERECQHPRRGVLTGREVLLVAARHAAEHVGQVELTRDLVRAGRGPAAR